MAKYRCNVPLEYRARGRGRWTRAEAGEVRDDLVPSSVPWLLAKGWISEVPPEPEEEEVIAFG